MRFCGVLWLPLTVSGQGGVLRGKVVSALTLQPLPGATLSFKHGRGGGSAGEDGAFVIAYRGLPDTLLVSYIGYQADSVFVGRLPGAPLVLALTPMAGELQEVLVSTGYQQLPKERATGSFVQVDNELFNRRVSTDVLSRLEDVTSGLIFNRESGLTNSISIRGQSTINADP